MHDGDADRVAFVDASAEKAKALPSKRSSSGFANEDDLYDL
jgi:phosphomannomutase